MQSTTTSGRRGTPNPKPCSPAARPHYAVDTADGAHINTYAIDQVLETVRRSEARQVCIAFRREVCLDRTVAIRSANPMSADVEQRLVGEGLMDDYTERPRYQRNDYLGWIARAKQPATRQKRIQQMLDELRVGGVYMNMEHNPSKKV